MTQIIHIGYPKTGSTWLQKQVFPYITGYGKQIKTPLLHKIYSPKVPLTELKKVFHEICQIANLIISDEDLVTLKPEHISPFQKAERIKALFPNARIIIFIRNQITIIPSAYNQYIKGGGTLSFKNYLRILIETKKNNHWKYIDIIDKYASLFGKESVKMYLFEEMVFNPDFLSDFLKENELVISKLPNYNKNKNKSLIPPVRVVWQFLNHFTRQVPYSSVPPKKYYFHLPLLFFLTAATLPVINTVLYPFFKNKINSYLTSKELFFINNYFKDSNSLLINKYNLTSILKYKYPVK